MKSKDFVELEEAKFVIQLKTFWSGLKQHGSILGFSNTEIDDAEKDYLWMEYIVRRNSSVQATAEAYTAYKKLMRKGRNKSMLEPQFTPPAVLPTPVNGNIEGRFRNRVARVKAHPNYSASLGEGMHIIAPKQEFDHAKAKPKFKVKLVGGMPMIKFTKKHFHAFDIYKNVGNGFILLQRVMRSPYKDESPLPEAGTTAAWKYKLVGVVNDKTIGQFSDEITIVVMG